MHVLSVLQYEIVCFMYTAVKCKLVSFSHAVKFDTFKMCFQALAVNIAPTVLECTWTDNT